MQSPKCGVGPSPLLSPARIHGDVLEGTSPPCSVTAPGMLLLIIITFLSLCSHPGTGQSLPKGAGTPSWAASWTGRAGQRCWVPTKNGREVTPWQNLTTGLSRGSHTSLLPLCPRQGGLQIPTAPAEAVAKFSSVFDWPATTDNLELKLSPKNTPDALGEQKARDAGSCVHPPLL